MALVSKAEIDWLRQAYPKLISIYNSESLVLEGPIDFNLTYRIGSNDLDIKDTYRIRLELPINKPDIKLKEIDGRLERVLKDNKLIRADLHIYDNGNLCIAAPQELTLRYFSNPNISDLFNKYIEPYFYSQSYYQRTDGRWPWEHFKHNTDGIIEWYIENWQLAGSDVETAKEIVKLSLPPFVETAKAKKLIERAKRFESMNPRSPCLCGIGKSYLQCRLAHRQLTNLAIAIRTIAK